MLTPPSHPAPKPDDPWDDDTTWHMPLPSEQAALDALTWNWGECYDIGHDDGQWWYQRKDGIGGTETAATPDELRTHIARDYTTLPVSRDPPPPAHTTTHQPPPPPGNPCPPT